jgi:hypothetical protein
MNVRRADPVFRRLAIVVLVAGTCAGGLLIAAFERYRGALVDWVRADSARTAERIELIFVLFALLLSAPLVAMAVYLSSLGGRAVRAGEFPPPGFRVIRDTPIVSGDQAVSRGRWLQGAAVMLTAVSVVMGLLVWRLASLFHATR